MAVSFCEIYNQNLVIKNDPVLDKLSPPDFYQLCWRYLKFAISYFYKDDTVDVGTVLPRVGMYSPFAVNNSAYVGNGTDTQYVLSAPALTGGSFYITTAVNGVVTIIPDAEYAYDSALNAIIFTTAPANNYDVSIANYYIGEFNGDVALNEKEVAILSEGMNIPYFEQAQGRRDVLNMAVYSGTFKEHSRAEHLQRLSDVVKEQRSYVDFLIMEYSYKYNLEQYTGLAGRFS